MQAPEELCRDLVSSARQVGENGGFAVEVLDSFMSGNDWEAAVDDFVQRHCWLFRDFDSAREIDLKLHAVWLEFERTIDGLLSQELQTSLGTTADESQAALEQRVSAKGVLDCGVVRLLQKAEGISTFEQFGVTMREAQERQAAEAQLEQSSSVVRVLWDIENMPIPQRVAAGQVADSILSLLKRRGWIDALVTLFHCPYKSGSLTPRQAEDLDKAGFEQVFCGRKSESADRKLSRRIQEMLRLPIERSKFVFVLISSDQDYIPDLMALHQAGVTVYVLHQAEAGSKHAQTLARYATSCLSWQAEVLSQLPQVATAAEGAVAESDSAAESAGPLIPAGAVVGRCVAWVLEREAGGGSKRIIKNFGFLESEQNKGERVFAHNTVLEGTGHFRRLHRNEKVWFISRQSKKGLIASRVGLLSE